MGGNAQEGRKLTGEWTMGRDGGVPHKRKVIFMHQCQKQRQAPAFV